MKEATKDAVKTTEYYLQTADITAELSHYKTRFYHKVVYLPYANPFTSKLFEYLVVHFKEYKLKGIVTSCGKVESAFGNGIDFLNQPMTAHVTNTANVTRCTSLSLADLLVLFGQKENSLKKLDGDGGIRSAECRSLLHGADIVVATPVLADFNDTLDTTIEHGKQFILLGPKIFTVSKQMAQYFTDGKINLGVNRPDRFVIPTGADGFKQVEVDDDGISTAKYGDFRWYSSFNVAKDKPKLDKPTAEFSPERYPIYVNYPAIDVKKLEDIPKNYKGEMGVPVTYLEYHDPKKYEIIGFSSTLAKPMREIAEPKTFSSGGTRFYSVKVTETDREHGYLYHREFDRVVIKKVNKKK